MPLANASGSVQGTASKTAAGGAWMPSKGAVQTKQTGQAAPSSSTPSSRKPQLSSWGEEAEKQYIITLTGGRKYTLSQGEVDWIRGRQLKVASDNNAYAADDEDQARKAAGELPRKYLGSYRNTKLDNDLYSLGLPSAKYLDQYVSAYDEWYGGGQTVDFGSADTEKAIKSAYQKSWEYDYTPEDQQRKAQGLMPAAFEASYADSYFDSDLFKRGLPSSKKLGDYVDQYNANVTQTNRVNEFYADVATQILQAQMQYGENGTIVDESGTSRTMAQYQQDVFFDTLEGEYSDLGGIYVKRSKKKDTDESEFETTADYREAILQIEEKPNPDVFVSYDDFATKLPGLLEKGHAQQIVGSAASKALGINTVGDAVHAQDKQAEFEKAASVKNRQDVFAYISEHPDWSAEEVLTALADAGVSRRQLKQARNYFVDQITDKENAAFETDQDITEFEAQIAEIDGLFDDIVSGRKIKKEETFDRNKFLDDWLTEVIQDDGRTFLSVDDAEKISDATIELVLPGIASNESFHAALDNMRKNGASAETILTMVANTVGDALATNPVFGLLVKQVRGAAEALERAGVVENVPFVKPLNELEAVDAIRETVNGARADRLSANIEAAREKAVELGISQYEFDQTLRRKGLDSILNPTDEARNYFIDVTFPRSLGADEKQFAELPVNERQRMARAAWDSLDEEVKAEYIADFDRNREINTDLHKPLGVQLENQILGKVFAGIGADIVSSAINLADMAVGWIGGDKGQWEVSKAASDAAARVKSLGVAENQSAGSDVLNTATTVGAEVIKMYALNAAGVSLAKAVLPAQAGATALATTGLKKLLDASTWVRMTPFVATSMGSYYNEAMQSGATRGQATLYGTVCGTIEGALESLSVDEWVGRGFGTEKILNQAIRGGKLALTAGNVTKWKLISLGSSAIGEALEEGASYFASYFMQRWTYNKDVQFSTDELAESMKMGAIIGLVGSGLSVSTKNASRIALDYAAEHGFTPTLLDIAFAATQVEAEPGLVERYTNPEILPLEGYKAVQRDIAQNAVQANDQIAKHETTLGQIQAELKAKEDAVAAIRSQMAAIDTTKAEGAQKWGKLAAQLNVAESELNVEKAQAAKKTEAENSAFSEVQKQHRIAIDKAQAKLDSHNVGMYNLFQPEVEAMRGMLTADRAQRAIPERSDSASVSQSFVTDTIRQKMLGAMSGTLVDYMRSAASVDGGKSWDGLVDEYGAQPVGKQPRTRDLDVPQQTTDENRASLFLRSSLESQHVSDALVDGIKDMVVDEGFGTYIPQSNEVLKSRAIDEIARMGIAESQKSFSDDVRRGKVDDLTVATGLQLLAEASARGDNEATVALVADLCIAGTQAGRTVQAFSMLKNLGGAGAAVYYQRLLDRLNTQYGNDIASGKLEPFSVTDDLMNRLVSSTTENEIADAEAAISEHLGQQMPLMFKDRMSNWRYFSMLFNPKTHVRNIVGNTMMAGVRSMKDAVATGIERAFVEQSDRTHAIYNPKNESARIEYAAQAFENHKRDLMAGGKYGFEQIANKNKRMFKSDLLNNLAQFNFNALEVEDGWFLKSSFINAYTQYMVAQNIDPSAITKEQAGKAAEWASTEAWRATFRDASALATALNRFSQSGWAARMVVEGVMPFKKTPINIAKRGIDYSPVGIIEGVTMAIKGARDGSYTPAQAIDRISSGLVGTGLMALGCFLAKAGVLRGAGDDDEKYEGYLKATGEQAYSLNLTIGDEDISMGLNSIAPVTIPLFMGGALYETIAADGDGEASLGEIISLFANVADPLMEMSFMSSLDNALQSYNGKGAFGALGNVALNAAKSYGGQFVPSIGGSIARTIDATDRTTRGDQTASLGQTVDQFGRAVAQKIPGASTALEPYINAKGERSTQDSFGEWALDFANQFILPGKVTVKNRDAIDDELIALYELTGETSIFPSVPQDTFTVNGKRYELDAEQYAAYLEDRGTAAYAAIKSAINSDIYSSLSDTQKVSKITKAIQTANKTVSDKYKELVGAFD